jgi:spermidine synthase
MMPWRTLDRATTSDGSELAIARRDRQFAIRVDGQVLMDSESHGSEEKLAKHGCAGLREARRARVLIGGLGMGFTARAALDQLGADARVDVAELVGAVVQWNRDLIGHLAGAPLRDPRLRVVEGDVADTIAGARRRYDAILLDVDNGPEALTSFKNKRLYTAAGLERARRALRPNGVLALWSAFDARPFTARLEESGFEVTVKRVRAHGTASYRHVLWLARVRPTPTAAPRPRLTAPSTSADESGAAVPQRRAPAWPTHKTI